MKPQDRALRLMRQRGRAAPRREPPEADPAPADPGPRPRPLAPAGGLAELIEARRYALFHDGRQVSKAHSTREAVLVEAHERRAVITESSDFGDFRRIARLVRGYEIRET